jgi:hypothetical protein
VCEQLEMVDIAAEIERETQIVKDRHLSLWKWVVDDCFSRE